MREGRRLETIEAPALLVDLDALVLDWNAAAGVLFTPAPHVRGDQRLGDLVGCVHAASLGCGLDPACDQCPVRALIREAVAQDQAGSRTVEVELVREGRAGAMLLRATVEPVWLQSGEALGLVVLEPVEAVA
jgi:hypothetical protein